MVPHSRVEAGLDLYSGKTAVQKLTKRLLTLGAEGGVEFKGCRFVGCMPESYKQPGGLVQVFYQA